MKWEVTGLLSSHIQAIRNYQLTEIQAKWFLLLNVLAFLLGEWWLSDMYLYPLFPLFVGYMAMMSLLGIPTILLLFLAFMVIVLGYLLVSLHLYWIYKSIRTLLTKNRPSKGNHR